MSEPNLEQIAAGDITEFQSNSRLGLRMAGVSLAVLASELLALNITHGECIAALHKRLDALERSHSAKGDDDPDGRDWRDWHDRWVKTMQDLERAEREIENWRCSQLKTNDQLVRAERELADERAAYAVETANRQRAERERDEWEANFAAAGEEADRMREALHLITSRTEDGAYLLRQTAQAALDSASEASDG